MAVSFDGRKTAHELRETCGACTLCRAQAWCVACTILGMAIRMVTCPETAHLEAIDYEATPHGMLIYACSRQRSCDLTCPRTCAARLDRRSRIIEARSLLRAHR